MQKSDHERPDLIIFDVEGTLVGSAGAALGCWERTLRDFALQAGAGELQRFAGADGGLLLRCQELEHYNRLIDVEPFCAIVECGSDVARGKPYPDLFETVLSKLQHAPAGTVAVGDTPFDAEAATGCGFPTIGVLSGGYSSAQLLAASCIAVISNVAELLNFTPLM
jgi:phosphoglycolate phosphatase-like HAD superfamily hydrolase